MEKGYSISKKQAGIIQGVAVLLMVLHHLFDFPDRIHVPYVNVFDFIHLEILLGNFGKVCVAIFAFMSGFGLYKKFHKTLSGKKFPILQCYAGMGKQLFNFLKRYWLVFAVFVSYGLISGVYCFNAQEFLYNFIGWSSTYNGEWWYVRQYFDLLLMFPVLFCLEGLLSKVIRIKGNDLLTGAILLLPLAVLFIWRNRVYNFCFLIGFLSVSTGVFDKICEFFSKLKGWQYLIAAVLIGASIVLRLKILGAKYDYINTFLFVLGLAILLKFPALEKISGVTLGFVGKYSTYIWLTHTFYAYYFFQAFTFYPKYSILVFLWCVVLSLATGVLLDLILKGLTRLAIKLTKAIFKKKEKSVQAEEELLKDTEGDSAA